VNSSWPKLDHHWCGGYHFPSNKCQVHWWNSPVGWISYPIRVALMPVSEFVEWSDESPLSRSPVIVMVWVGPAAPFPFRPPVQFHADNCNDLDCDNGCLYE
jgi:hypothetical protein